jgi:hypothetical protein
MVRDVNWEFFIDTVTGYPWKGLHHKQSRTKNVENHQTLHISFAITLKTTGCMKPARNGMKKFRLN